MYDKYTEAQFYTMDELSRQSVRQLFIVDFGIIKEVSTDKTKVTVRHCAIQSSTTIEGVARPVVGSGSIDSETITKDVEILYLGSSFFGLTYDVQVGDVVLLLGSKDFKSTVANTTVPEIPAIFPHYRQENLKAIPLKTTANVNVKVTIDTVGFKLDAGTKNVDIYGTNIKLGSNTATESFVKGDLTSTQFDTLLSLIKAHTHVAPSGGGTTDASASLAAAVNPIATSIKIKGE